MVIAPDGVVRAAGVVLLRQSPAGPQVLVVHRPKRRDWSLPKGKLDPGESWVAAAVRECAEETGITPVLGPRLANQRYEALGRPKVVRYWVARAAADLGHLPDDEVDERRWVPASSCAAVLTYPRDVDLVTAAVAVGATEPLVVLRHAQAVKRAQWHGADAHRPLSGKGRSQAQHLTAVLGAYGVAAVYSSDATRCHDTVRPYADLIRATIEDEPVLSEEGHTRAPDQARRRAEELLGAARPLVVCSHRPVLPTVLGAAAAVAADGVPARGFSPKMRPGSAVVLHRRLPATDPSSTGPGGEGGDVPQDPCIVSVERHGA